jgi:hypothetical protein
MKDPAALFYIDTWLSSTAEMDSDVRGWYLNLILHQYDKKDLPNDIEKLAVLAGVKFSEFQRFKQVFEQVLKHKFSKNDNGRLENNYAKTILQKREIFKDKREKSGNIGVVIKLAKSIKGFTDNYLTTLKDSLYNLSIEEIEKHKDKQMLEHMLKLYINENKDEDISIYINDRIETFKTKVYSYTNIHSVDMLYKFFNYWSELNKSGTKMRFELEKTWEIEKRLTTWKNNVSKFDKPAEKNETQIKSMLQQRKEDAAKLLNNSND